MTGLPAILSWQVLLQHGHILLKRVLPYFLDIGLLRCVVRFLHVVQVDHLPHELSLLDRLVRHGGGELVARMVPAPLPMVDTPGIQD